MLEKEYEYCGYKIEIHENPIYHDFEFVIKTLDSKVVCTSTQYYDHAVDAEKDAKIIINEI